MILEDPTYRVWTESRASSSACIGWRFGELVDRFRIRNSRRKDCSDAPEIPQFDGGVVGTYTITLR